MYCRDCGKKISEEAKFCENCGMKILDQQSHKKRRDCTKANAFMKAAIAILSILLFVSISALGLSIYFLRSEGEFSQEVTKDDLTFYKELKDGSVFITVKTDTDIQNLILYVTERGIGEYRIFDFAKQNSAIVFQIPYNDTDIKKIEDFEVAVISGKKRKSAKTDKNEKSEPIDTHGFLFGLKYDQTKGYVLTAWISNDTNKTITGFRNISASIRFDDQVTCTISCIEFTLENGLKPGEKINAELSDFFKTYQFQLDSTELRTRFRRALTSDRCIYFYADTVYES